MTVITEGADDTYRLAFQPDARRSPSGRTWSISGQELRDRYGPS